MYRPENLSIDGTRFLGRWNGIIPVYDVLTMQGLNAIVGCVKHNNAAYGTVLYIEDVGIRIVQDKGSAIQGKHLDVAVDTHENAKKWSGCGNHRVWILKEE
jgi:3D (Asp-Asp-Asp) domain-containing protein